MFGETFPGELPEEFPKKPAVRNLEKSLGDIAEEILGGTPEEISGGIP